MVTPPLLPCRFLLVVFPALCSAATLSAGGLIRRDEASPHTTKDTTANDHVQRFVVGPAGKGTLIRSGAANEEIAKQITLKTSEGFPFGTTDSFEFRVAPLRWATCNTSQLVMLSSSDQDWKTCAARVQSMVGERSCSRRRGNMLWPRNPEYMLDEKTTWYPCLCCADDAFNHYAPKVNATDAIWNVVWDKKDCAGFSGTNACGKKLPEDHHAQGTAVCQGGECDNNTDRWTCCHSFASNSSYDATGAGTAITSFQGTSWGAPYLASETVQHYNRVGPQACGHRALRPAMPKTANATAKLALSMRDWSPDIAFAWIGLRKDQKTGKWMWDDNTLLVPQPNQKGWENYKSPWDVGEPSQNHNNQRGCVDRKGLWHGCSFSVQLRIACETSE